LFPFIHYSIPENTKVLSHSFELDKLDHTQCIKIKISPEKNKLQSLAKLLNEKAINSTLPILRFDGNRKFELTDLIFFLNIINVTVINKIEYIEEPFKNFYDIFSFNHQFKIPIAIDESLSYYAGQLELLPKNMPIILKPALFGISKSFEIIRSASQFGHNVIVSSTYQPSSTFIPMLALAHYSDSFHLNPLFHGLDTLSFLPISYQNNQVLSSLSIS
jgi:O-succinylbenzoate synthase